MRKETVSPSIHKFTFEAADIASGASPGQFIQARSSDHCLPLWPRPFSIHDVDPARGLVTIMFRVYGSGTAQMATRSAGDLIHLFGPLGNSFPLPDGGREIIMAAGGVGLPPLYFLSKVAANLGASPEKILFIAGARTKLELLNEPGLFDLGLKPIICTDDGTAGRKGTVVETLRDLLSQRSSAIIYSCGPNAMLRAVDFLLLERGFSGFLSLEALMPCGYGICSGCAVKVSPPPERGPTDDKRDYHLKRVCIEGPVFRTGEVMWD